MVTSDTGISCDIYAAGWQLTNLKDVFQNLGCFCSTSLQLSEGGVFRMQHSCKTNMHGEEEQEDAGECSLKC
jgi:hypothetical protein